ncbi:hypothetical protein E6P97_00265 [Patescibacteria group bacterium]|nr:MAG: hypothetical protein E6P97_00265 [Patescibacteria group bacterium]
MTKQKKLVMAGVLIVAAVLLLAFGGGKEPETECAPQGVPYSGMIDPDKGDCPISNESWERVMDYREKPKPLRMVGLVSAVSGIGFGIAAVIPSKKH